MEPGFVGLLAGTILIVLLFGGVWIGAALGVIGFLLFFLYGGFPAIGIAAHITYIQLTNYGFVAMPLFIFMATLLAQCGISERLYTGSAAVFARLPGGLLHANVAGCALFASICGSNIATSAAMTSVALPELRKRGYPMSISLGSLASAGTLGPMIPPSLGFIVYGILTETSIGQLFVAGIFPGIMLASLFMTYIVVRTLIVKDIKSEKLGLKQTCLRLLGIWPVIALFVLVLGTIYAGICTATEAGALGCTGAFIVAIVFRQLSWRNMRLALRDATRITIMIFFILVGAMLFGYSLSNYGVPQYLLRLVIDANLTQYQFLGILTVFYFILGMFMDGAAMQMVTLPIVFPAVVGAGINPVWYGVVMCMYGEMCALTPPVGMNLFVVQGIAEVPLETIIKGVIPFVVCILLALVLLVIWPEIALFLPSAMF